MSNRTKGAYYEAKVADELRAAGALVEKARAKVVHLPNGRVFSTSCDLFSLFDGIAVVQKKFIRIDSNVVPDYGFWILNKGDVLFYQVKFLGTKESHINSEVREKIRAFPTEHKALIIFRKVSGKVERAVEWL
jgi:hypothetical protein